MSHEWALSKIIVIPLQLFAINRKCKCSGRIYNATAVTNCDLNFLHCACVENGGGWQQLTVIHCASKMVTNFASGDQ